MVSFSFPDLLTCSTELGLHMYNGSDHTASFSAYFENLKHKPAEKMINHLAPSQVLVSLWSPPSHTRQPHQFLHKCLNAIHKITSVF